MAGKDRRKMLARQRYERQQQRREAQRRRARQIRLYGAVTAVAVAVVGGGVAYAVTSGGTSKTSATNTPAVPQDGPPKKPISLLSVTVDTAKAPGKGTCTYTASPSQGAPKGLGMPPTTPAYTGTVPVTVKTNLGTIGFGLDAANAPCTTNSFAFLATHDYFNNTKCHRLTTSELKVLQCGDPTGTGMGGPGYKFAEENLPKAGAGGEAIYQTGTLAMANAGPGTNGSQFFIVWGDSPLPPGYTIFGKVTSGLNVVDEVAKAGVEVA